MDPDLTLQVDILRTCLRKACQLIRRLQRGERKVQTTAHLKEFGLAITESKAASEEVRERG